MLQVLADDVVHGAAGEGQQGQLPRGQPDEHLRGGKQVSKYQPQCFVRIPKGRIEGPRLLRDSRNFSL